MQCIINTTGHDPASMTFVVEALWTHMLRSGKGDPCGVEELKKRKHDLLFKPELASAEVRTLLDSPLAFYTKVEGPDRDATWVQTLPHEALRLFMRHAHSLLEGYYKSELRVV